KQWDLAVEVCQQLWKFYPDDIDLGLLLTANQISAGKPGDALSTVSEMRRRVLAGNRDPRLDLTESNALGGSSREAAEAAATRAKETAKTLGARHLLAESELRLSVVRLDRRAALEDAEQARKLFSSLHDPRGESDALISIGRNMRYTGGTLSER